MRPRKLARVGMRGDERPVIVNEDGSLVSVDERIADFDSRFWTEDLARLLPRIEGASLRSRPSDAGLRFGAPISMPGKVVCIGLNYRDHARETGMDPPTEPIVFMKPGYTVVGPNDDVWIPPGSTATDYEVELGVVIGARATMLKSEDEAWRHIGGFVLSNDVSERHWQFDHGSQWMKGKSFETFNPTGPWLVLRDELVDVGDLPLELTVNGEARQRGTTADMIFGTAHLIWYLSQFMVLEPGDLINTGTPAGVAFGQSPPRYLRAGDVIEAGSASLGRQRVFCRPHPLGSAARSAAL